MKNLLSCIMVIALTILMTNCASIVHGSRQQIAFSSQPSGATVYIDGRASGTTPTSVTLKRKGRISGEESTKKQYAVQIAMDGYYPYEIMVKRSMDGWFLGNLVFGGLIGIIVDAASGSMYQLTPDQVIASMGKNTAQHNTEDGNIVISVSLDIDPSWKKIGQLEKKN